MLDDFKKSIQLVLNERISSPFSGSFLFSWVVWNWRLIYYLFSNDGTVRLTDRISYVESNYLSLRYTLLFPAVSAVFLIAVYPFITTGALWIWLKFKKTQQTLKNNIEGQQLLNLEQSISVRLEVQNQQDKFDRLLKSKDAELLAMKNEIERLQQKLKEKANNLDLTEKRVQPFDNYNNEISDFINNNKVMQYFPQVMASIQNGYAFGSVPTEVIGYLEGYGIIQRKAGSNRVYEFTEKGKLFLRKYSEKS